MLPVTPLPTRASTRPSADGARTLDALRRWAILLDSAFRVPGTSIRFGLDAILGLLPGLGDLASPIYTGVILLEGLRRRLPAVVQARMVLNAAIDMGIGLVPLLGDMADVAWKANLRNLALLERHVRPGVAPRGTDYALPPPTLRPLPPPTPALAEWSRSTRYSVARASRARAAGRPRRSSCMSASGPGRSSS